MVSRSYTLRYLVSGRMMYDMTESQHLEKMISTRIEVANIDSIDKLARGLGITRSAWIRQAILAELVMELTTLKEEEEVPRGTPCTCGEGPLDQTVGTDGIAHSYDGRPCIDTRTDTDQYREDYERAAAKHTEPPDLSLVTDLAPVYGLEREHHIDCIKSIDHEGDCLD